ncbi:type II toxin-antitoxin system Phd/YefM family antitoxin [Cupriavidus basilensis]
MRTNSFSEEEAIFAETLRRVEMAQEPLMITKRGQAVGVLMSWSQYRQLVESPSTGFSACLAEWRKRYVEAGEDEDPFAQSRQTYV